MIGVPVTRTVAKKRVKTFRRVVFNEAVVVRATFYFEPPKHRKYGDVCEQKPDLDKLHRAIGDALTDAHVIFDDCRIVGWPVVPAKIYGSPRVEIAVQSLIDYEANSTPLLEWRPPD